MTFIVTAGPTREYIDPVRFLSNPSTGRMGFAVARAAHSAGHASRGPVALVMTAAVADWRPARCAARKLKKSQMSGVLKLVRNPDILKTLQREFSAGYLSAPHGIVRVGFAAETGAPAAEAARKCREKGLDLVVGNDVTSPGSGFGTATNRVTFVFPDGSAQPLPLLSKLAVARRIVDFCVRAWKSDSYGSYNNNDSR